MALPHGLPSAVSINLYLDVVEEGEMGEQKTFSPKLSSSVWMSREVGRRRRRRIWREGGRESGVLPASSISFSH